MDKPEAIRVGLSRMSPVMNLYISQAPLPPASPSENCIRRLVADPQIAQNLGELLFVPTEITQSLARDGLSNDPLQRWQVAVRRVIIRWQCGHSCTMAKASILVIKPKLTTTHQHPHGVFHRVVGAVLIGHGFEEFEKLF